MIYLHSISETRMKRSHTTNLRMFQKLADLEDMGHVILTTTIYVAFLIHSTPNLSCYSQFGIEVTSLTSDDKWDKTPEDIGKNREVELLTTDDVRLSNLHLPRIH